MHRAALLDVGVGSGEDLEATLVRSLLDLPAHADPLDRAAAAADRDLDRLLAPRPRATLYEMLDVAPPAPLRAVVDALDATGRAESRAAVLAALLVRAAKERPQLVVVEDVHWADAATRDRLATVLDTAADCAALVMVTARREGDGPDAPWRAGRLRVPFGVVELSPLRTEDADALAAQFRDVPPAVADACVDRADGNPLFLEQLLRGAAAGAGDLPDTVQSLVRARLDALPALDRRAAESAAVIGQRVPLGTLRHLLERPDYAADALVDAALLRPTATTTVSPMPSCARRCTRRCFPRTASPCIDGRRAGSPTAIRCCTPNSSTSPAKPGRPTPIAAPRNTRRRRPGSTAPCGSPSAAWRWPATRRCARVALRRRRLAARARPRRQALRLFETATAAARDDTERCRAETGIGACLRVLERHVDALAALDRAEAAATRAELRAPRAAIAYLRGNLYFPLGRLDECLRAHETALAAARDAGSVVDEARAESGLGDAYYQRGDMPAAGEHFARCIEFARAHDLGHIEAANLHMHGLTLLYDCDATGALRAVEDAVARTHALGAVRAELVARTCICDVGIWVGDWPALLRDTEPSSRWPARSGRAASAWRAWRRSATHWRISAASPRVWSCCSARAGLHRQRRVLHRPLRARAGGRRDAGSGATRRGAGRRRGDARRQLGEPQPPRLPAAGDARLPPGRRRRGHRASLPSARTLRHRRRAAVDALLRRLGPRPGGARPRRRRPGRIGAPARRRRRPRLRRRPAAAGCGVATRLRLETRAPR